MKEQLEKFRTAALHGSPLEGEIVIDAHMHIGRYNNFLMPHADMESIRHSAKRIGIQKMYGSSLKAIRGDAPGGNADALALHTQHPASYSPYFVLNPNYPEDMQATIDLAESVSIRHFKLHDDGNDLPYDHRNYSPFYEYADAAGAVVLAHTYGRKHVAPLMSIAAQFPGITILLGHSGIIDEEIYAEAVRQHPNMYLETCCSLAWYGLIERLVGMAGGDRVLFGSDMPFMSPDQQIGRILLARITDEDRRKILGLNALRILR
jgi:hypothetical protein